MQAIDGVRVTDFEQGWGAIGYNNIDAKRNALETKFHLLVCTSKLENPGGHPCIDIIFPVASSVHMYSL